MDPVHYLSAEAEKNRYLEHNNNPADSGYRQFVSPIVDKVKSCFNPGHKGLDFGAGTGQVVAKMLQENGYSVAIYDPFFCDCPERLALKYDYVICCEVIEHFCFPGKEFLLLKKLLNPGGMVLCMTDLYSEKIDFPKWYYKNDPTHVFFYHRATLQWIKKHYGFPGIEINGRLICFKTAPQKL